MALLWNRIEQRLAWCMTFCLRRFVLSAISKKTFVATILPWVNSFRAGSDLKISNNPKENHIAVLFFSRRLVGRRVEGWICVSVQQLWKHTTTDHLTDVIVTKLS